jgi:hypothetical protein
VEQLERRWRRPRSTPQSARSASTRPTSATPDELLAWRDSHVNEQGNPTVKGYCGPCWSTVLPFDVDRADPAVALADTRRLVGWLTDHWDIPPEALTIVFSGSKGYNVEVPAVLFGGFEPGLDLPDRLGTLARRLLEGSGITVDWEVYQPLRLWRVPNTVHE